MQYSIAMSNPLREFRKRKGFTQHELGELLGVSQSTVAGWEAKRRSLDAPQLALLGKLGADVVEIVNWSSVGLDPESPEGAAA